MTRKIEVVKEIRFAVVMYGGVSLAIYINGVAQELLRMVRATAVNAEADEFQINYDDLDESEKIYREFSYLLGERELLNDLAPLIADRHNWQKVRKELAKKVDERKPAKVVRFVVDILSGSSAGGINAVYLSKALVGGQKINSLENLWIKEGNFSKLLNDKESVRGTRLQPSEDPLSLFDSRRMYWKLLEAFEKMDKEMPISCSMLDELDLFVTATDFWGLPVPVRLFDRLIHERNHRRRLHFKYQREGTNDFQPENYPFLAYAARSTSSFPFAFDPMKLSDTALVLDSKKPPAKLSTDWKSYFPKERLKTNKARVNWEKRIFVDGGTLDNKPFGYAIETLGQRQANVLIDRKLIYIEPKPDQDGGIQRIAWNHKPDALTNTFNIVSSLPGYETIREDLQQVLERNRLIVRVNYIVSNARKDEYSLLNLVKNDLGEIVRESSKLAKPRLNKNWAKLTLAELARDQGQSVYSYYRLRMSAVTDDLARIAARRAGFDEDSDYFLAIRSLVRVWRLKHYNKEENESCNKTITALLYEYDFNYRLRRLRFVLQEADRLLAATDNLKGRSFAKLNEEDFKNDKFAADLKLRSELSEKIRKDEEFQAIVKQASAQEVLRQKFPMIEGEVFDLSSDVPASIIFKADKDHLRSILREFKKNLNQSLKELNRRQLLIETRGIDDVLKQQFKELNKNFTKLASRISANDLANLLDEGEDKNINRDFDLETSDERGSKFLKDNSHIGNCIDGIADSLRRIYNGGANDNRELSVVEEKSLFGKARLDAESLLSPQNYANDSLQNIIRAYLWHFYKNFDNYDRIIFPITFETPIGEGDIVEVARISPADATSLIDESKGARKKLAGDTFFSFSAFFNHKWRKNDIMWGRLDAVERLVELISTGSDLNNASEFKKTIINEVQKIIWSENKSLFKVDNKDYIDFVRQEYKVDKTLDENLILKTTGRALTIAGKILRSPAESPSIKNNPSTENKQSFWIKALALIIDYLRRFVNEISSDKASLKTFFYFATVPFLFGLLLIIPFLLVVTLLILGTALIILNIQSFENIYSLLAGVALVLLFFLITFYCFKFYEFQKVAVRERFIDFIKEKLTN